MAGSAPNLKHTVVSRPLVLRTISVPVLSSRKLPVPYVFLASPGAKHTWPAMAACWSPSTPVMGSFLPNGPWVVVVPYGSGVADGRISGSMGRGTVNRSSSSSSQSRVDRSISMVRLALVTSVRCTPPSVPPVRFHSSQVSIVPKIASPRSASLRKPVTLSSSQRSLPPEK